MGTLHLSVRIRTARIAVIEPIIGVAPTLELWSGVLPANCAAANIGTKVASGTLPTDWLTAAAGGAVEKVGVWSAVGLPAAGGGTNAVHFRIRSADGAVDMQGDITVTGGGGMITLDDVNIRNNKAVTITSFTVTDGNAGS